MKFQATDSFASLSASWPSQHFSNSPAVIVKSVARQEFLVLAAVTPERKSGSLGESVVPQRERDELS